MKRVLPSVESIVAKKKEKVVAPPPPPPPSTHDTEGLIQTAFEYIAECITKEDPNLILEQGIFFDVFASDNHAPIYFLTPGERQRLLKRVAETSNYQVSLAFNDSSLENVPSYVFDWKILWRLTDDHIGSFGIDFINSST